MMQQMTKTLTQALRATCAGDLDVARLSLRQALNLAPTGATLNLVHAGSMLLTQYPVAAELYENVTKEHDLREAWLGLAAAHHLQARSEEAAEALAHALGQHAAAASDFTPLADEIAFAVSAPGWCTLESEGRLVVRLVSEPSPGLPLVAMVDRRYIKLRAMRDRRTFVARLPVGWERAHRVAVRLEDVELLASPLQIGRIARVEGFVDTRDGDLHGWAWCPGDPERDPILSIVPAAESVGITVVADKPADNVLHEKPLARPRSFRVPAAELRKFSGPVRVFGHDGRNLLGSPVYPAAERLSAEAASKIVANLFPASPTRSCSPVETMVLPSAPAHLVGHEPNGGEVKRPVDIVVPVWGNLQMTIACLNSVLVDLPRWARVVVVDDASPDLDAMQELEKFARHNGIKLLTQRVNRGFPGAANIGMRHDLRRDVVLLNSDTLSPPGWLARLRRAAYSAPNIGSATPLSNDATIFSYPSVDHSNLVPDLDETILLDELAQRANANRVVDVPTANGFCVYIKRDCLEATGLFREDQFAQGYGEENDFCIRARHLGWRHVAVPSVFVAHIGSQSFGLAKKHLVERNLSVLNRLHPGYDMLIRQFQSVDPLAEPRRQLDMQRWNKYRTRAKSVLLVTHGRTGGVERRVAERAAMLRTDGFRPIVLWPIGSRGGGGRDCVLGNGPEGGTPNLRFAIPSELDLLVEFLKGDRPIRAEVHHLIGHDHALFELFQRLGIPYDAIIHDYSWFCPRVNLVGPTKRYCGEPHVDQCEACVADAGTTNDEDTGPHELRERSRDELTAASRIVVPSKDAATRIERHFPGIRSHIVPWEDEATLPGSKPMPRLPGDALRVCVAGAIGIEKGYELLLECARDAARRELKVKFHLVGFSCDDSRLLETGTVQITGRYQEHEAVDLIRSQEAHLAWLPSLWPETWCYTLTQTWVAGLNVLAFDIGAQAERIRRTGRGWLVPLGIPPSGLNNKLLALQRSNFVPDAAAAG
jgi:GT2 family glycosyltransferase/glycosyltransferase involved in cell wall biosynthesis